MSSSLEPAPAALALACLCLALGFASGCSDDDHNDDEETREADFSELPEDVQRLIEENRDPSERKVSSESVSKHLDFLTRAPRVPS